VSSKFLYADNDEIEIVVEKANPYKDPTNGRFTTGGAASAFSSAGGTISAPMADGSTELKKAQADMDAMTEAMGDDFRKDKGVEFTKLALNENEIGAEVKVARAEDGIAGAIQYAHLPSDMANTMFGMDNEDLPELPAVTYISYLGSTGIVNKTGTALTLSVFEEATKSGTGILLESADASSTAFWKTLGLESITGDLLYLAPDKVKERING